jgi:hypothetical protein
VESRFRPWDRECFSCRILREREDSARIVARIEADCGMVVAASILGYFEDGY